MKNIILISMDNLRYDAISFDAEWRSPMAYTPYLNHLLSENTIFCRKNFTTCPVTPPAHTSMLTGLDPDKHMVYCFNTPLPENVNTLATILKRSGYDTMASVEHFSLKQLQICREFDFVDVPEDGDHKVKDYINDYHGTKPCFMFIHNLDIHKPYNYLVGDVDERSNFDYYPYMEKICGTLGIDYEALLEESLTESLRVLPDHPDITNRLRGHSNARSFHYLLNIELNKKCTKEEWEKVMKTLYYQGTTNYIENKFKAFIENLTRNRVLDEETLLVIASDHGESVCKYKGLWEFMHGSGIPLDMDLCHVPLAFVSRMFEDNIIIDNLTSITNIFPFVRAWANKGNPLLSLQANHKVRTFNVDYSMDSMRFKRGEANPCIKVTEIKTWKEEDFDGRDSDRDTDS